MSCTHIGNELRLWLIQSNCCILINFVMQHKAINLRGTEVIFNHNIHSIIKRNGSKTKYCITKFKGRRVYENQNNHSNMHNKIIETDYFDTMIYHYDHKIDDGQRFNHNGRRWFTTNKSSTRFLSSMQCSITNNICLSMYCQIKCTAVCVIHMHANTKKTLTTINIIQVIIIPIKVIMHHQFIVIIFYHQ
eukprot:123046_1